MSSGGWSSASSARKGSTISSPACMEAGSCLLVWSRSWCGSCTFARAAAVAGSATASGAYPLACCRHSQQDVRVTSVGRRVVVTGMAGAGKSTFSRVLSTKTGLPVIQLDVHFWKPGWVPTPESEWRDRQRALLSGAGWIVDGNDALLDLRLERADTAIFLDTPWWICAQRALRRGLRTRPAGFELPPGCVESRWRRLRDAWSLAWRICRDRGSERDRDLAILSQQPDRVAVHILQSGQAARDFLTAL